MWTVSYAEVSRLQLPSRNALRVFACFGFMPFMEFIFKWVIDTIKALVFFRKIPTKPELSLFWCFSNKPRHDYKSTVINIPNMRSVWPAFPVAVATHSFGMFISFNIYQKWKVVAEFTCIIECHALRTSHKRGASLKKEKKLNCFYTSNCNRPVQTSTSLMCIVFIHSTVYFAMPFKVF